MLPSLNRLNKPSLPQPGEMITEATITAIAPNYTSKGLRLCDIVLLCTFDPTYDYNKPLQTGQYFKWVLLPGRTGLQESRYKDILDDAAYEYVRTYGEASPRDTAYEREVCAILPAVREAGSHPENVKAEIANEFNRILTEFPEQMIPKYAGYCIRRATAPAALVLRMMIDLLPRIKAAKIPFDLMRFKSPDELRSWLTDFENKAELEAVKAETDIIFDDASWLIVHPQSWRSAVYWGRRTSWCTSRAESSNYYNNYSKAGKIITILAKVGEGIEPTAQLYVDANGHYARDIADVGTVILNAQDNLFRADSLYANLGSSAIDAIANYLKTFSELTYEVDSMMGQWSDGDMNDYYDAGPDEEEDPEPEDEDEDNEGEDGDPAHQMEIYDTSFSDDFEEAELTIEFRDPISMDRTTLTWELPYKEMSIGRDIPQDTAIRLGLTMPRAAYLLSTVTSESLQRAIYNHLNSFFLESRNADINYEEPSWDDIRDAVVQCFESNAISLIIPYGPHEDTNRRIRSEVFGTDLGPRMSTSFETVTYAASPPPLWRPALIVPSSTVVDTDLAKHIYQASLSFWASYGRQLSPMAAEVYERGQRLLERPITSEDPVEEIKQWLELPVGSPEFWVRAAFIIRVIDRGRRRSFTSSHIEDGVVYSQPFKALTRFLARASKGWGVNWGPDSDFAVFMGYVDADVDADELKNTQPFRGMSASDQFLYDIICLKAKYSPPHQDSNQRLPFGVEGIKGYNSVVSIFNGDDPDEVDFSTPYYRSAEESFRDLGLSGIADSLETAAGKSKQQQLAFSRALQRKGKRL